VNELNGHGTSSDGEVIWQVDDVSGEKKLTKDIIEPTRNIFVEDVSGFNIGDFVIIRTKFTQPFIDDHNMTKLWNDDEHFVKSKLGGIAICREITDINSAKKMIEIDIPTRYYMLMRDSTRMYKLPTNPLVEVGIEDLSIGMKANSKEMHMEEYTEENAGTGAFEVHGSHAITYNYVINGWIRNVHSYKPTDNAEDIHLLSNGIQLAECKNVTVQFCNFQKPQFKGPGGNGYMYTFRGSDCLIRDCVAIQGRHNYSFKSMQTSGNVILNCLAKDGMLPCDYHQQLSVANLVDNMSFDNDAFWSTYRVTPDEPLHAHATSQSVFWNCNGMKYKASKLIQEPLKDSDLNLGTVNLSYIITTDQFGYGYVIGTRGPCPDVNPFPGRGQPSETEPMDYVDESFTGHGEDLAPASLYLDQLSKRLP
jgi:hypothetical protein